MSSPAAKRASVILLLGAVSGLRVPFAYCCLSVHSLLRCIFSSYQFGVGERRVDLNFIVVESRSPGSFGANLLVVRAMDFNNIIDYEVLLREVRRNDGIWAQQCFGNEDVTCLQLELRSPFEQLV